MKTAEFFIAGAGFINAILADSAPSVVICGLMFVVASKKLMKQFRTSSKKHRDKKVWNWEQCIIPRKEKQVEAA